MPVHKDLADWTLLIGPDEVEVHVEDAFVRNFAAASAPFARLIRWPTIQESKTIPLSELNKFTSKMETYFLEGRYDDAAQHFNTVHAPAEGERRKFLDRPPQLPWAIALERCAVNLDMYAVGERFQVKGLCPLALQKLEAALPLAAQSPVFWKLVLAARAVSGDVCVATLASHARRSLKAKDISPAQWRQTRANIEAAREVLCRKQRAGWREDEADLRDYILAVEANDMLRGFDVEEKEKPKEKQKRRFSLRRFSLSKSN